jgi:two-component system, NarL family, sensor histidine kinase BarA
MSYRTIRRIVGETNLERKVRALLGVSFLTLVCLGFFLAAHQNENLVRNQTLATARLLVNHVVEKRHLEVFATLKPKAEQGEDNQDQFVPENDGNYNFKSRVLLPQVSGPVPAENKPMTDFVEKMSRRLLETGLAEISEEDERDRVFVYLKAVRAKPACLKCHNTPREQKLGLGTLKEGDFMAAVNIRFPMAPTEYEISLNRAILLFFGIGLAALAMLFTYMIVRYVIVKPLAHLRHVSEEVAAGNLAVRAELKSGDEFAACRTSSAR